eukprot:CAMPEP_0113885340 /NCGR_PEP_ID=MMETSP0780_2-20120614/10851_1 /TAXON_ID=652834 /ORGANISM="Palpitomonas bilix" /LENGTH=39 /DNA_ID=CAMNT_0000873245 /DNA_START=40 /DNA_END=155 /DNA_ORIENTATION=+ /assembly_acc=CAM_ASM_000599
MSNLTDKSLKRELADKKVRGLLIATDLAKGNGSRPVAVG